MRAPDYFARFVLEVVARMDRVVVWEQGAPTPELTWPEMGDPQWRDAAINAIDKTRIQEATFHEPTAERDWIFTATRRSVLLS